MNLDVLFTPGEAADLVGIDPGLLRVWRTRGLNPWGVLERGRHPRFSLADVCALRVVASVEGDMAAVVHAIERLGGPSALFPRSLADAPQWLVLGLCGYRALPRTDAQLLRVLRNRVQCQVVNLCEIYDQVCAQVFALQQAA